MRRLLLTLFTLSTGGVLAADECPGVSAPIVGQLDTTAIVFQGSAWENQAWMAALQEGLKTAERLIGFKINIIWRTDERAGGAALFNDLNADVAQYDYGHRPEHVHYLNLVGDPNRITMIFGGIERSWGMRARDSWLNATAFPPIATGVAFRVGDRSSVPVRYHGLAVSSHVAPQNPSYYGRLLAHELVHAVTSMGHVADREDLMYGGSPIGCRLSEAFASRLRSSAFVRPL